jgi:hypothetical protein
MSMLLDFVDDTTGENITTTMNNITKKCIYCLKVFDISFFTISPNGKTAARSCRLCNSRQRAVSRIAKGEYFDVVVKNKLKCVSGRNCEGKEAGRYFIKEFHHFDPRGEIDPANIQGREISSMSSNWQYWPQKFIDELNKCVVLCANCHSEITNYEIKHDGLKQRHQDSTRPKTLRPGMSANSTPDEIAAAKDYRATSNLTDGDYLRGDTATIRRASGAYRDVEWDFDWDIHKENMKIIEEFCPVGPEKFYVGGSLRYIHKDPDHPEDWTKWRWKIPDDSKTIQSANNLPFVDNNEDKSV